MQISKPSVLLIVVIWIVATSACSGSDNALPTTTPMPIFITEPTLTIAPITSPIPTPQSTSAITSVITPCVIQSPIHGHPNLFQNYGFEAGASPWCVLSPPAFEVSTVQCHSGQASAYMHLDEPSGAKGTMLRYLVQEIAPTEFPEFISGYYRVEKWNKGTPKQYLQFVIIVFEATNRPYTDFVVSNRQIRYPLAGISEDPFSISNAHFVYIGTEEPEIGEWVYFERHIKQDFEQLWGAVPEGFTFIRILFEVRYDDKEIGAPTEAKVYYDDLYLGTASENTNHPL